MPNWCTNDLTVTGPAKDLARFKKKSKTSGKDEDGKAWGHDFSFEPHLPLPKCLDIGPDDGKVRPDNKAKTGFSSWYDRNNAVLGTKWDVRGELCKGASDSRTAVYSFESAWSPPEAGVMAVSALWPTLQFELTWDEPGCDFAGKAIYKDGVTLEEENYDSLINRNDRIEALLQNKDERGE
jgi:hypothetical protein